MERKEIENLVKCCQENFRCNSCPCEKICEYLDGLDKGEPLSALPIMWSDEDIDNILDAINKEE